MGPARVAEILSAATYLEFESKVMKVQISEGEGQNRTVPILVYGAPYSVSSGSSNRAFQDKGSEQRFVEDAPERADVVVTHGPAESERAGSVPELLRQLHPRLHCSG